MTGEHAPNRSRTRRRRRLASIVCFALLLAAFADGAKSVLALQRTDLGEKTR